MDDTGFFSVNFVYTLDPCLIITFCDYRLPLRLLLVFSKEREMLESRGRLMIRELCRHLDPRRLYVTVARAIQQDEGGGVLRLFSWEDFSGMIWESI